MKSNQKEKDLGFEEMDGTLQALLDLSMMTLEPCNNRISLVKVPKRREETTEFQSSFELVICKTMRTPLNKID